MAKRKIIRKPNRPLTVNSPRYYSWGGGFKAALGSGDLFNLKDTFSGGNVANMLKGGLAGTLGSAIGKIGGNLIGGDLESGAGSAINNIGSSLGSAIGMVNPLLGGAVSAGAGLLSGAVNSLFGSKLNKENIEKIEGSNTGMNTLSIDDSSVDSVINQWTNQDFGSSFSQSDIGKDGLFSNKAKNKYKELKRQQDIARNRALTAYDNAANYVDTNSDLGVLRNFSAYGGPLEFNGGAIDYEMINRMLDIDTINAINRGKITSLPNYSLGDNTFAEGGSIHIKPENRGKFTALKKRTGKSASWFKEHGTPAQKKMATFALNAKKWKHSNGGPLLTHGGVWSNGTTEINNGGTHEENPFEGVQIGVDNQGIPNLVEEGELIYNDYVFSNRIKAPEEVKKRYRLRGNTFADVAKNAQKESKERPNDPISKRGLDDIMSKLEMEQEAIKSTDNKYTKNKYPYGGLLTPYYDAPENTMYDLISNRSVYSGDPLDIIYGESKPYRFGTGVTASGEWTKEPKNIARASAKRAGYNVGSSLEDYNKNPIANPKYKYGKKNKIDIDSTWLRYAPVVGAAIGLGQNLFSSPDYSSADAILEAANKTGTYTPIGYTPIGNYLTYRPFDRNYYTNKLSAQSGAARRAILNTTSPSRNAALLAEDYNTLGKLGDLARQAEEYNLAQRQAVETFNRGTNMTNSEMGLKAAMANQEAALKTRSSRLSGVAQAMSVRDAIDARRSAGLSSNLTNLFDSLGNIGIDAYNRADRDMLIKSGVFGTLSQKPEEWSDKRWDDYKKAILGTGYSKGGKLKKRRGGLTY